MSQSAVLLMHKEWSVGIYLTSLAHLFSFLNRIWEYVNHDLRLLSCQWRRQPNQQIRTYKLLSSTINDQQNPNSIIY